MEAKKGRVVAIVITLLMHIFIISILLQPIFREKHKKRYENIQEVHLIPNQSTKIDTHIKRPDGKQSISDDSTCKHGQRYRGVGFIYLGNVIRIVPPGYPAYDAGLHPSDIIIDMSDPDGDGYEDIIIQRNDKVLHFHIRVTYICFRNTYPKS
jgi:hypothetical protein